MHSQLIRRCKPLLGTFVEIECDRANAIETGFAAIERVHQLMSAHDPKSELSLINRHAHERPVAISGETREVLQRALHWSKMTRGAFDVVHAGNRAILQKRLPLHPGQPMPHSSAEWTTIRLFENAVSLTLPACIDLGGIAKGYAVDLAIEALQHAGATLGLVNAGGDLRAFGDHAFPVTVVEPWTRRPLVITALKNAALATSAGLPTGNALSFDHLICELQGWTSVTVEASLACDADALAKIPWAIGHEAAELLALFGAHGLAIDCNGKAQPIGQQMVAA